jgi:hypothetical protein
VVVAVEPAGDMRVALVYQSRLDFSTGFGVRLDTEGRRDQVNTLPNPDRPAVSLEQRERPGIPVQETPHGLGNRLGLVARVSGFWLPLQSGR